ncbi:hypothetical protein J6590_106311, partial [Homalodisca vitripennis]
ETQVQTILAKQKPIFHLHLYNPMDVQEWHLTNRRYYGKKGWLRYLIFMEDDRCSRWGSINGVLLPTVSPAHFDWKTLEQLTSPSFKLLFTFLLHLVADTVSVVSYLTPGIWSHVRLKRSKESRQRSSSKRNIYIILIAGIAIKGRVATEVMVQSTRLWLQLYLTQVGQRYTISCLSLKKDDINLIYPVIEASCTLKKDDINLIYPVIEASRYVIDPEEG